MRTTNEIREELDQAIARRAELWNRLSQGSDAETSAELAGLSKTIDELRTLNMPAGVDIRVKALLDEK